MVIGLCGSCLVLCPECPWSYVEGGRAAVVPTWSSHETCGAQHLWVELTWPGLSTEPRVCHYLLWLLAAGGPCLGRARAFGKPWPQPLQQLTCVVFSDLRISRKAQEETVSLLRRKGNSSQWAAGSKVSALPPPGTGRWAVSACRCSARCTVPL